jgi:hypothetical protein
MSAGSRHLLRDLCVLGLVQEDRLPARRRLERELSPATMREVFRSLATAGAAESECAA